MVAALFCAAGISAIVHLAAWYAGRKRIEYVAKPLTTILILVAAASMRAFDERYQIAIVVGLAFSLAGDVFLMLPRDHFIAGLLNFLLAHLAYIAAFSLGRNALTHPLLAIPYAIPAALILIWLWPLLGRQRVPVAIYVAALVVMAWQAAAHGAIDPRPAAIAAAIGAALFIVSDATLAIDRFRKPFHAAQGVVMTTYVAAQMLIAGSVA